MTTTTPTARAPRWLASLIITVSLACGGILVTGATNALAELVVQVAR